MATNTESFEQRADDLEARMTNLEDRMDALNNKIDVATDSIGGDIKTVLEQLDGFRSEMRREFAAVRKEHRADQRLIVSVLKDHVTRLRSLERQMKSLQKSG